MQCSQVVATHIPSRCRCMACMVMAPPAADDPFAALASCPISAAAAAGAASGHWVLLGRHRYCPLLALLRSVAARELTAPACSCATQLWSLCDWCSPGAVSQWQRSPLCATLGCKPAGSRLGKAGASVHQLVTATRALQGSAEAGRLAKRQPAGRGRLVEGCCYCRRPTGDLQSIAGVRASNGREAEHSMATAGFENAGHCGIPKPSHSAASAAPHSARCGQWMPAARVALPLLPLPAVAQQQATGLESPLWRCLVSWAGSPRL